MITIRNLSLSLALALIPVTSSADEAMGKKTEARALSLITATPEEGFQVVLRPLYDAMKEGRVTLVYSARDEERNQAVVLRRYLSDTR